MRSAAAMLSALLIAAPTAFAQVVPALAEPPNLVELQGHAQGHAQDHVLVQVAPGVTIAASAKGGVELRSAQSPSLARASAKALREAGVRALRSPWIAPLRDAKTAQELGLDRWYIADLVAGTKPNDAVARLRKLTGGIAFAGVDHEGGLAEIPNDPNFGLQYALLNTGQVVGGSTGIAGADVSATAAWNTTHGDSLVVAVLDSGIDPHAELAGRILPGINVPDGTTVTADECNHGTHVAGIIAASGGNGVGIAGLAWNVRLLPVVVVNGCSGFEANVATGLTWAVDQGARLVNMSLQFYAFNPIFLQAVQYAHAQGALMCAATGNTSNTNVAAPAKWNETIAVAATDNRDVRASFSNFGPEVDISAPGVNVFSLSGTASYIYKSGTSMATPHVAGAAALLWGYNPSLTRDQVRAFLLAGATDLGDPGTDVLYGAGRLNIAASLALAPPPFRAEDLNRDGAVDAQDVAIMLSAWSACANCDACVADLNGDCDVGSPDLAILLSAW